MAEPIITFVFGGAIAIAAVVSYFTDEARKLKRRLKKAPRRSIRHLPDRTYARYSGKVLPIDAPIEAPLTARRCAYWRVVIEERRGKSFSEILRREAGNDFSIRDDSGTLLVRVAGAKLAVEFDGKVSQGMGNDPTKRLERFLAAHGEKTTGWFFNRTLQCTEAIIEEGESVTVAGIAHAEPDPDAQRTVADYRGTPMRMVLDGARDAPVLITDDPDLAERK